MGATVGAFRKLIIVMLLQLQTFQFLNFFRLPFPASLLLEFFITLRTPPFDTYKEHVVVNVIGDCCGVILAAFHCQPRKSVVARLQ